MNPLPPQAYTKDTLTKAYMWLVHQNSSIKELATTPDILVSLFLKAQRNGDESLDTPSIQNFKNELKSLAGMMGELENGKAVHSAPPPPNPLPNPTLAPQPVFHAQSVNIQNNHHSVAAPRLTNNQLDPKSQAIISEVREHLNLSSDLEVIRLLIALGYNKAKNLYS
jgi:hypothetical protein